MRKFTVIFALCVSLFATLPIAAEKYKVQSGDTMYKIAGSFGLSLKSLLEANPKVNPNLIYPGQLLNLPNQKGTSISVSNFDLIAVELVNAHRTKRGLPALELDGQLTAVAREKAADMLKHKYFSHTSPSYGSPFAMMNKYGIRYTYAGENIARGQEPPEEVVADWMASPGHRSNILNSNFDRIGVAHRGGIWVQLFIKSK